VEAFLISAGVVAFAELGDKTQLLAILLAARFRAPLPIVLGILGATALNHTLAALLGLYIGDWLGENLRWILAASFLAMGIWTLIPDWLSSEPKLLDRFGPFAATLIAFFLIEIGTLLSVNQPSPCTRCGLASKYLFIMRHIERNDDVISTRFYVLYGCKKRSLFNSEKEAAEAWNKDNPTSE